MKVGTHRVAQYGDVLSVSGDPFTMPDDYVMTIVRERIGRTLRQGKVFTEGNKRWVLFKPAGPAREMSSHQGGDYDPFLDRRIFGIKQNWDAVYAGRWPSEHR